MLALTALSAASEEQRAQVQSITLSATPPSYQQLVADRQQRVRDPPSIIFMNCRIPYLTSANTDRPAGLDSHLCCFMTVAAPTLCCPGTQRSDRRFSRNAD